MLTNYIHMTSLYLLKQTKIKTIFILLENKIIYKYLGLYLTTSHIRVVGILRKIIK